MPEKENLMRRCDNRSCMIFSIRWRIGVLLILLSPTLPAYSNFTENLNSYLADSYEFGLNAVNERKPSLPIEILAKAKPDECFYGITDPENPGAAPANVYDPDNTVFCSHNKVNQAYVWGMTKAGDDIWFGTGPNVHCLVSANYLDYTELEGDEAFACEFGASRYLPDLLEQIPASFRNDYDLSQIPMEQIGDWRPPGIFVYNTRTRVLTEKTPFYQPMPILGARYRFPETLINATIGVRSAGTLNNVVILAGPSGFGGIDMYAYRADNGAFITSANLNTLPGESLSSINNIRKWLVVEGQLYTTVGVTYSDGKSTGGKVLRWTGNVGNPFQFEVVGTLDSAGAELAFHEGRIFISTWSGEGEMGIPSSNSRPAGLYMSPSVPENGLTAQHAEGWSKVWSVTEYEPSKMIALTYGGGALASFKGYLYWGTMHVPALSHLTISGYLRSLSGSTRHVYFPDIGSREDHYAYDETTYRDARIALMSMVTQRSISIFRGKDFGRETRTIELLYGQKEFPTIIITPDTTENESENPGYVESQRIDYIAEFAFIPNKMGGAAPLYGPGGFGNTSNNYTWAMGVFKNQLFVGTMNHAILDFRGQVPSPEHFTPSMGANLFRFPDSSSPAIAESVDGLGNYASYGIRTMISDDALYLGMANPMNILTDDKGDNIGGWELIKLGDWIASPSGAGKIQVEAHTENGTPVVGAIRTINADSPDVPQTGKPSDMEFPDGLVSLVVEGLENPGNTVRVTLTLPREYPDDARYYKVTDNGFEEFLDANGDPLYEFDGNTVTLILTDGDYWDKDGEVNGRIQDPGGAAQPVSSTDAASKSGGGGCFVSELLSR